LAALAEVREVRAVRTDLLLMVLWSMGAGTAHADTARFFVLVRPSLIWDLA
jgi:hypothetical protein